MRGVVVEDNVATVAFELFIDALVDEVITVSDKYDKEIGDDADEFAVCLLLFISLLIF